MGSKYLWLFDAGHGGMIDGKYQTRGKCSPDWKPHGVYFEGVGNRNFVKNIMVVLKKLGINCVQPVDTEQDIPLRERTRIYNEMYQKNKTIRGISIHSNGGGGQGMVVFTSEGQTESDKMATAWYTEAKKLFPDVHFYEDKRDKDPDREENFWVLKETNFPIFLTENFFMDHINDYMKLWDEVVRRKVELAHVNGILNYEGLQPIDLEKYVELLGTEVRKMK